MHALRAEANLKEGKTPKSRYRLTMVILWGALGNGEQ